jgi:hypothetical protein
MMGKDSNKEVVAVVCMVGMEVEVAKIPCTNTKHHSTTQTCLSLVDVETFFVMNA